jgi:ElaB/YqjD/DUF883 family membrane-anchored ribosome-binding protein
MDGETSKERLVGDLKTLITDAEELLKATTSQAGEKVTAARQRIEQSLIEGKRHWPMRRKSWSRNRKNALKSRMTTFAKIRGVPWGLLPASVWSWAYSFGAADSFHD